MTVRRRHRRAWGALLLGLLGALSLPAFGQLVYRIDSPSEIWLDQLASGVNITVCCTGGGSPIQQHVEGAPSTLSASMQSVGGSASTWRLQVTGTFAKTWQLRLRTTGQFHGGSSSVIWRTSNTIPVHPVNQRHVDIDTEPSTTNVQEQQPLRFTEGGGALASKSYRVKLSLAPTANVTLTVTSGDTGAVTVDTSTASGLQSTLTFTTANWDTWQTVTANAVDDTDFAAESVTITHAPVGGGYTNVTGTTVTLAATVADDEAAEVLVDANPSTTTVVDAGPLVLNEDSARTGNYSVRLSRAPTGTVTVALASDNAAVTLSASSLTFTTANWNTAQTVTATTTPDADAADEAADVTHTASGGGYGGIARTLRVGVTDDERTGTDYDTDEDGLIEIDSLAKLNAVRWDLDGTGVPSASGTTSWQAAFPGASYRSGCPDTGDANQDADPCKGYELTADLDFDTDGSGASWSEASGNLTCDANDSYYNSGSGWDPIGPAADPTDATHYNAVFEGNGHSIDNLCIDRSRSYTGLFAALRPDAEVRSLSLTNAGVYGGWSTAPLAAQSWARVAGTYTSGTVRAPGNLGGLVGVQQGGTIIASYSTAAVHCTSSVTSAATGGLVGDAKTGATILTSYAAGAVTGACPASVKSGLAGGGRRTELSYWDTIASGIDDDADALSPEGKTTNQLQAPTAYGTSGIYAQWGRQDVDGDGVRGEPNDDDAWNFGSNTQYPALKFGGASASDQFAEQPPSFGTGTVADMTLRGGEAITPFQIPVATHSGAITYTATGLPSGLSFDADATGACSAGRTICGTPALGTFAVAIRATGANGKSGVLRFTMTVLPVEIEIDTDPNTADTVDAGPLALVDEAGHAAQSRAYGVRLAAPATGNVTVTVTSSDTGAVTVDTSTASGLQSTLTFTTANWNTWQTVTAAAVADADSTDESVTVSHAASGGGYAGVSESLTVEVDDALGAAITTSPSALTEANLNGATVTVTLTGATFVSGVTASSFSLTGATLGMSIASATTVSAGDTTATLTLAFDGDISANATFAVVVAAAAHSRSGALTSNTVTVAASPGVTFTPASLALTEGASATYTVALASVPAASVTVTVTGNNAAVTVDTDSVTSGNQGTLTFTTTNWNTAQTVTAAAVTDSDAADETATLAHAASGGGYSLTANLFVAIQDPDQTGTDYDSDEDGLIEIDSLAKLNAIRWDRDGNGSVTGGDATNYQAAFPNAAPGMGCPDSSPPYNTPGDCDGYELTSDLNFDTNDDGLMDSADDYWNGGAGWAPIHYSSNLRGNGHIIYNLYVSRDGDIGLFSQLDGNGRIYGFGLVNVEVECPGCPAARYVGGLAGFTTDNGTISSVFVTGVVRGARGLLSNTGGLIGRHNNAGFTLRNTYTAVRVVRDRGWAGGLMGTSIHTNMRASISRGTRGPGSPQPLFGRSQGGSIADTYWDSTTHGTTSDNRCAACARTTTQLQSPTGYTGIYVTYDDYDVDGDGVADDAWDFGTDSQYPVLKFGGFDTNVQFMLQAPSFGGSTVTDQTGSAGAAITAFQIPPASHPGTVVYTVEGLPAGLVFDVDGSGSCGTALQICGTPTAAGTFTVTVWVENTAGGRNIAGASTSLSFDIVIAGVEIDANPATSSVTDPGPLVLTEHAEFADNAREYAVRLTSAPTANVTVTVTSADTGAATVDTDSAMGLQSTLTFTTTNWNTWQTVTAAAVQDSDFAHESVSVTHAASGGGFNGRSSTLTVEVVDDEVAEVLVDADTSTTTVVDAGPLLLNESSALTGSYSVRLSRAPTATATVTLASDNPAVTLSASALTFTTTNWATAQTVTATTTADTDAVDEAADVTHTASGGGYGGREAILRVGVADAERADTDYDTDEDGLIEIDSLAKLNAIRWDLDGNGRVADANATNYRAAFPSAAAGMGCPDGGDADQLPDPCRGYELTRDLDFDTNDNGFTWERRGTQIVADTGDGYYNGGSGWDPLGPSSPPNNNTHFNAVFEGNGHVIRNLFINRARAYTGLFAALRPDAEVRSLGLPQALTYGSWSTAPLAGQNWGRVAVVWSSGIVLAPGNVGGLVGVQNSGATIVASYSMAAVECTDSGAFAHTGGLVGANNSGATVAASYAIGAVTGACPTNRKYGLTNTAGRVRASYWDTTTSAIVDDGDSDPPEGRTTSQLQTPTQYGATGLYATWNDEDVDGDGASGGVHDDAWNFGTNAQYPVLTFAGTDPGSQRSEHPPSYGTTTVSQQTGRTGVSFTTFQVPAATHPETLTYTASGLPDGLSFDGDGNGACGVARAICGTPTRVGTYTITVSAANAAGASVSISFTLAVGGIEIDADPDTTPAVEAGPLALEERIDRATNSDTYAVRLTSAPSASVTVTVTSSDTGVATVDTDAATGLQSTLTFTTTNWNAWQTVTAQAVQDADAYDERITISHAASSGAGFDGVSAALAVTVNDDEPLELLVDANPATPAVDTGSLVLHEATRRSGSFSVRLSAVPSGTVTVTLASDNPAVTLNLITLTFTTGNWGAAQTVTATASGDSDAVDEAANVTHTASGGDYDGVSATLLVGVTDDDRTGTDYDTDEDGLIEINTLAQLNAVRWDLDGTGIASAGNASNWATAFPGASFRGGCPDGGDANQDADSCKGYELARDLDFDTDGSGFTYTLTGGTITGDANDAYDNGGMGWDPLGPATAPNNSTHFNAVFDGNGHVIRNLFINRVRSYTGLFAALRPNAVVRNLGLPGAYVRSSWSTAPLAGQSWGRVAAAWATGTAHAPGNVGGLVGVQNSGATMVASYAMATVECTDSGAFAHTGGLVGANNSGATVAASYAAGTVIGACPTNRKYGLTNTAGTVIVSYWDTARSGIDDDADADPPEGRTTLQLQTPTAYGITGIYALWYHEDVDGDGATTGFRDDAWDFGTDAQYPALKFGGASAAAQRTYHPPSFGTATVTQQTGRTGVNFQAFQVPAAAHSGTITYTASGLPPGLSFDGDGSGDCSAMRTICGTPTMAGTFTVVIHAANANGDSVSLSFELVVGGIEIDTDPDTTSTVETDPLALEEHAGSSAHSATYAVRLTSAPSASVTVTVTSSDTGATTVDTDAAMGLQSTLTFTTTNWNAWQTVTAQAVQDADLQDESVTITHAAGSGGGYNGVSAQLTATVDDDELPEVFVDADPSTTTVVDDGPLLLDEDAARTGNYAVTLSAPPTAPVTVALASDNPAVTLSASALTFTTSNWAMAQTVTATTTPDADAADEAADVTHTASGGGYDSVTATLRVGVADDERTGTDYDTDEDGLIEINTLAQLHAVRWDLDADGDPVAGDATNYNNAFSGASTGMGCPDGGDVDQTPDDCIGYELMGDLDFDTDGDGSTHTSGTGDGGDAYYNIGEGWYPIGPSATPTDSNNFTAIFDGNGHSIYNLFVNRPSRAYTGLFAALRPSAVVRNLGLPGAYVRGGWSTAALAGQSWGRASAVWSSGTVRGIGNVGGLVGVQQSGGAIVASYSTAPVSCSDSTANAWTGGLVGENMAGGTIAASYATGAVTGACPTNRKFGLAGGSGAVTASYWDTTLTGINDDGDDDPPEGRTTTQMQAPTSYADLYSMWNGEDVDGDGVTAESNQDDAWDFGTSAQHPALKIAGHDTALQFNSQGTDTAPDFGTASVTNKTYQRGEAIAQFQVPAATGGNGAPVYTVTGLPAGLEFDVDGSGTCGTARAICGTPTTNVASTTVTVTVNDHDDNTADSDTLTFTIGVVTASASISSTNPAALNEGNLNNATVTVTLTGTTFGSGVAASNFTLGGTVPGVQVASLATVSSGDTTATLTLSYSGTNFDNQRTLSVTVAASALALESSLTTATVNVSPTRAITLSPTSLMVNEQLTATYTVALGSMPTGAVTVAITGAQDGISVDRTSLAFTASNWDTAQTVTVSAADDQDSTNEQVTLTHTASGADYGSVTATLSVTAQDDDTPSLRVSPTNLMVDEGSSRTYTIRLNTLPTATVTVTVGDATSSVTVDTDGITSGDQDTLTFTATSWETNQTVTVTAAEDDNGVDETVTLSHAAAGGNYGSLAAGARPGVSVQTDDNDTPAVLLDADPQTTTVDEAGPLALQERTSGNNSDSYSVRLATEPTQDVTVTITSADAGAVAAGASALTFTSANWDTAQTVTLTAQQDADGVAESVVVTNAASTASMSEYTGLSATITATVEDDEAPGFVFDADTSTPAVDDAGPLMLDELAGSGTNSDDYSVRLSAQPTQDVTVTITSDDTGAVTVGTSTLTFTTTNWDTAQTVTLTAQQDLDAADEEVDIEHAASTAANSEYTGVTGDFDAEVDDDETAAITLSPTALNVNEQDSAAYTVALSSQPTGAVTVAITGVGDGISIDVSSLTFSTSNWNTAVTVTASAGDDQNSANESVTLTHTASGAAEYDTLTADLEVTALDNDTPSLRVTPTALTVPEADSRTYTVRLNTQPSATVTVTVNGAASGVTVDTDGATTGDQNTLTFTDSTWETDQTVTVSAAADDNGVDEAVSLSHAAAGGDYGTITGAALPGVSVTADDDDTPAVVLDTDPQTLTMDEPGPVALKELAIATDNSLSHAVRLATEPTATVTVTITSADDGAVTVDTSASPGLQNTLTFTATNWDTRQSVTLAAAQDADGVAETVVITHAAATASTSEYTNVSATLTATVEDDEAPAFVFDADPSTAGVVDAAPLNLDELSTSPTNADDYSVKLSSQPTQDVTVAVGSPDTGAVTVGTSTLTFTTTNWNTPQTVTATAAQDLDGADESVDVAHAASTATPSEYTGITGDFEVAVDDDETAGITLAPTSLTVQERRSETYTVVLDTEPVGGNVTVSISGATDGIAANPTRLVFTAANWNTARTVTARAADDANSANEVVTLTHAADGADYDGVSKDLEVTASDDDQPGLRVSPTQLTVREEAAATYRVRLNAQPSAAVTVTVGGATAKVGVDTDPDTTGDQTELAFDATDWNRWKTVRVRGIDDDDGADETASLTHAVAGASEYTGLALEVRPGVAVTVDDRDVATVELSLSSLALSEGGGAAAEGTWTVRLANLRPTGPVSVAVTSGDPAVVLTGAPVTLNFTTANWDTAQSVAARAVDDDNAASERVEVRHAATGANYGGAEAVLRVVVTDDEAPPDAPTGLAATPGDGSAALSWSNPENPSITRYEHRFAQEGAPLGEWRRVPGAGPNTTSLTVSGLVNGRAYVFEVRAGNEIGDGEESRTAARLAAAPAAPATVPDAALAAAVRTVVGKSAEQPLTAGDLAQVLELDLSRPPPAPGRWRPPQTGGEAVKDLRGMEAMPNLRRLYLDNNEVADLSPLLGLVYLEHVSVRGNPLTSDSVFVHAAALRARGVEVLLDAATLATLADPGLRRAVEVALGKDPGAALTEGDLLTLSSLSADSAGVSSLSGIEAASRLQSLTLAGNAPAAGGAAMPLSPLAGLRSLTHLDLSDNGLTDVSALSGMTGLRSLLLAGNALEDLSPLSGLTGLEELTLSRNGLSNVSALSGLSSLRQLWLDGNGLESVKPLRGLSSLVYLHLGDNRISDIEPLAWLADLRRLWLPGNMVEDVSALSGLWRLSRLDLERNRVSDVSPLAGLPELSQLRLGWNRVADVSALADHAGLADSGTLGLRGNPLRAAAVEHQVPALRRAGAAVVVGWPAPLFPSASAPPGRSGFVRVLNRSEAAGEALVEALDEAGRRVGPARLSLGPRAAAHFNSADLERGNAAKGLPAGVGRPTRGGWRLLVSSALDVEVLSYLRAPDGSLVVAHGELLRDGGRLSAFVFNPGGDREQRSSLRIHNPGASSATAWPWGVDDAGRGRSAAGIEISAGVTAMISSRDLESSRWGRRGLGDGEGRWRLRLGAPWPLSAQTLLEGPNGHLSNLSSAPVRAAWDLRAAANADGWDAGADWTLRLPLFPPAGVRDGPGRDGLVRVVNLSPWEGWAQVAAVDDAGVRSGPVRLRLPPRAAVHFDSAALEAGDADQGPPAGVGAPTKGAWRLELRGNVAFAAAAYARHADGFLTSLHETAPSADGSARVALFNPASNQRQRSLLRLANDGAQPARATITGMDDAGAEAGPVSVTVPAGAALTLTAVELEEGGDGLAGALGDGEGKWRLTVAFDRPLVVMSLMESAQPGSARGPPLEWQNPAGRLSNLSAAARP